MAAHEPLSLLPLAPSFWFEPNAADVLSGGRAIGPADLSANGRNATALLANAPLVVAGAGPRGSAVYRFASARPDFLTVAHDTGLGGTAWTVFVVIKTSQHTSALISKNASNAARPFDALVFGGPLALAGERTGSAAVNTNAWKVTGFRRGGGTVTIYAGPAVDVSGSQVAFSAGTNPVMIGRRPDGYGAMTADLACVVGWARALTDQELTGVHAYFAERFGV